MKTKIELQQAINVRKQQGRNYDDLLHQLKNYPETTTTRYTVTYTPEELKLIPCWLKDNKHEITE